VTVASAATAAPAKPALCNWDARAAVPALPSAAATAASTCDRKAAAASSDVRLASWADAETDTT
jgi:hypothetical protein